jgi:hypothetical protein
LLPIAHCHTTHVRDWRQHLNTMNFTITLRQAPLRLATKVPQLTKSFTKSPSGPAATLRAFHQSTTRNKSASSFFTSRTVTLPVGQNAGKTSSSTILSRFGSRGYQSQSGAYAQQTQPDGSLMRRLLVGGAIFGGTMVAINVVFNRETRDDGGMPVFEREYLNNTFLHTGLGIGIIGLAARQMVNTGFVYRMMVTSPWIVAIGGLALSFGTMMGTRAIPPEK